MGERNEGRGRRLLWFYPACLLVTACLFCLAPIRGGRAIWLYLGVAALFLFAVRPGSAIYARTVEDRATVQRVCTALVAVVTIVGCTFPMGLLPIWNGERPGHRNQYELMAEAILDGHIDFDYGDEDALKDVENPYKTGALDAAGIPYHWDHAYYNGHYYMYFGIVPVLLVFLPYRVITGASLTTYHATQLFTALTIVGIFVLFGFLAKRFFKKLPFFLYLALAAAFSVMSVWYATAEPALYCTAISSGVAFTVWSIYFYVRAVWGEQRENRQIAWAAAGALCGALVFGCRPTIGLANVLVIPLLVCFLRQRKITGKLMGKLALAALPYVVVGVSLMVYNYVRFDDPFEFGQRYQLTVVDQRWFSFGLDRANLQRVASTLKYDCFRPGPLTESFPYFQPGGVFANFPILLLLAAMFIPAVFRSLRRSGMIWLVLGVVLAVVLVYGSIVLMSPFMLERYHMDFYFLLGIGCFVVIGLWYETCQARTGRYLCTGVTVLCAMTVIAAVIFYLCQLNVFYSESVDHVARILHLG